jgi:hypothetical protein
MGDGLVSPPCYLRHVTVNFRAPFFLGSSIKG